MNNIPLVYITSDSPTGFGSILTNEIARTISDTVAETQKGIYGMQKISKEYKKTQNYKKNTEKINIEYQDNKDKIDKLAKMLNVFPEEMIAVGDGINDYPMFEYAGTALGINVKDEDRVDKNFATILDALEYMETLF